MTFKLKYMPLYGNDFWADQNVKLMSDRMEAWYLRLLWDQFLHESLPDDPMYLYALASPKDVAPDDPEWERFMGFMDRLFPVEKRDGRRRNPRMAEERNRQWTIYRARKQAAEATNKAKQDNRLDGDRSGERGGRRHASVTHIGIGVGKGITTSVPNGTGETPEDEPTFGTCMKLIRTKYALDPFEMNSQGSILKALNAKGYGWDVLFDVCAGLALLRGDGTLLAPPNLKLVYNDSKGGGMLWESALSRARKVVRSRAKAHHGPEKPDFGRGLPTALGGAVRASGANVERNSGIEEAGHE